ncbi:hypothetical protein KPL71_024226 [Citrus sinensis]|uniref:Uncharacterized protein n=1 Tax=Citrus sinensis TaxID=2711 RepID=A0ACB8IQG8_CITSI|nr:hypothetical protein KPL71_024226 [Citrus sinensis]
MGCRTWERMGKPHGQFDVVITAHNGDSVRPAFLFLSVCECYMQCSDFGGAFVRGVDSVSWMANNSTKLLSSQSDGSHCWTFFSTTAYREGNKVPLKVKTDMLEVVEATFGLPRRKGIWLGRTNGIRPCKPNI